MKRPAWIALGLVLLLAAGVWVWPRGGAPITPGVRPPEGASASRPGTPPPEGAVRLSHAEDGLLLAASVPLDPSRVPAHEQPRLAESISEWLAAYSEDSPARFLSTLRAGGVAPPPTWADPAAARELWHASLSPLRGVDFEPAATFVQRVNLASIDDPPVGVQRCGRRDAARPFLAAARKTTGEGVEVVLVGSVIDSDTGTRTSVQFAMLLVRNPEANAWVIIRTCLRNFPNAYDASPPVL